MEQLLRSAQPALILATDHLFELVEQSIERHSAMNGRNFCHKVAESLVASHMQAYWKPCIPVTRATHSPAHGRPPEPPLRRYQGPPGGDMGGQIYVRGW